MPYAVELFFNPALESRVRRVCAALREGGIRGDLLIDDVKARPHVTLCVCDDADVEALEYCARQVADKSPAIPVSLSSIGVFPTGQGVAFLAPVVSEELLDIHRALHDAQDSFTHSAWPVYSPARWVPHCTLVNNVPREEFAAILNILSEMTFPLSGEFTEIGAAEFADGREVRKLFSAALQ